MEQEEIAAQVKTINHMYEVTYHMTGSRKAVQKEIDKIKEEFPPEKYNTRIRENIIQYGGLCHAVVSRGLNSD